MVADDAPQCDLPEFVIARLIARRYGFARQPAFSREHRPSSLRNSGLWSRNGRRGRTLQRRPLQAVALSAQRNPTIWIQSKEAGHPLFALQSRDVHVQIHPIDSFHLQGDVVGQRNTS
jgi:hypothetical protein